MTIWQLYHSFFHYIWTLSYFKLPFLYMFFSLFNVIILISNLVLLINSHHCFRQQKNAANSSKNRQKPRRRTENTVRFQQWGECRRRREVGGVHLGSRSLRTYLQQKGQGFRWWRWGSGWGEVHLHRSTGLRLWTARDRRSGARGVSLLHPQLSLRECSSPHHSLSRKRKRKRRATQCTHSNQS